MFRNRPGSDLPGSFPALNRMNTSGGSSHRLESRKLEPFLDFGGRARRLEPFVKGSSLFGARFHLNRNFPLDFGSKKTQKPPQKTQICMFFELLLSNEPFYIFLGSDSIYGSSDSFIFGQKARTRSSLKIRDSTCH
jgi:hypothetical protein